jgi:hypothetical protein
MSDIPALLRRVGAFSGLIGAALIFVGGLMTKGETNILSYIGVVLAAVAWALGVFFALRKRSLGWLGLLALAVVGGAALAAIGINNSGSLSLILLVLPIAYIGAVASLSVQDHIVERSVIAALGIIALMTIIVSGAFAGGGGIGSTTDPKVYQLNLQMYVVATFLAVIIYVLALINTLRIGAWGWFTTVLLLFGIGAMMFGLFGPTAEDIRQGRLQRAARRAAGVR